MHVPINVEFDEASRRSSVCNQNSESCTPVNPIDVWDNQEPISVTSITAVEMKNKRQQSQEVEISDSNFLTNETQDVPITMLEVKDELMKSDITGN